MKKKCIICGREFECYDKPNRNKRGVRGKSKRPFRALTCRKDCAFDYAQDVRKGRKK